MDSHLEQLSRFFEWAVVRNAKLRYRAVFDTKRGVGEFLNGLHDKLESQLKESVIAEFAPSGAWDKSCTVFKPWGKSIEDFVSVHQAYELVQDRDTWFILTSNCDYALYRGELYFDNTVHIVKL